MYDICNSGGADGADSVFTREALAAGHVVRNWGFSGMATKCPPGTMRWLSPLELVFADKALLRANRVLKRQFPCKSVYVNNLLRRNFYQVYDSDRVYAISALSNPHDPRVRGGTGWAVQMAVDLMVPQVYVFDQDLWKWSQYDYEVDHCDHVIVNDDGIKPIWREIDAPPKPSGKYTGIGSREINAAGIAAIEALFHK